MTEPNSTYWGMVPTVSHKGFEFSNDQVHLVVLNLTNQTGMAFHTSRPFVTFLKLAHQVITNVNDEILNLALSNLYKAGACVIQRRVGETNTMFMFYLEEPDEPNIPYDQPARVDEKLAGNWLDELEALRLRPPVAESSSPVVTEDDTGETPNSFIGL